MSWTDFKPEGDPVRGNVAEFEKSVEYWRSSQVAASELRAEFRSIVHGGTAVGLTGLAADAFANIVKETESVLDDVPEVFGSMREVLDSHLTKLTELKAEADAALARAKVAHAERASSARLQSQTVARIAMLQRQITEVQSLPPEQEGGQLLRLESQLTAEKSTQRQRSNASSDAQNRLQTELNRWNDLRKLEDDLNRSTSQRLDDFDLRSLRDPSWLEQQVQNVGRFISELASDTWNFLKNAALGDWDAALFYLYEVLDKVLTIVSVIALVAMLVATVVSFGALAPLLAVTVLVLASIKLIISTTLVLRGATHPETGERMGWVDVAFDAVAVALAAFGVKGVTGKPAHMGLHHIKGLNRYNVGRAFLKQQIGLTFKRGYEISAKKTAINTTKIIVKRARDAAQNQIEARIEGEVRNLGDDGGSWQGTSPEATIGRDIQAIRQGQPGLTTPVQTVVIGTY